ncbi:predicted protein [Lichtheimia corymbifera JMRC:FSU:9682]|uniref:mRNA 3'-end-processing protein n=1 Tax=Lichtheimia corymbifera JMRC:FSU:9682 TaxID=1263082 RepID=A0A068SG90_9FUNG|nr:predicted protein [Lichtheimia corymbifera JMRC:FSU:9682]
MADNSLTPNLLESFDRLSLNQLSKSSPSRLPPFQLKRSRSQQGPVPPLPGNSNDHPPSSKQNNNGNNSKPSNLSHVPCKFFKQGTCTAGANCIFSHNPDPTSESAVCKYYLKGNCKFGSKCALLHTMSAYAPDGRKLLRGPSAAAAVARSPPVGSPLDFGPHMYSPARATTSSNTNPISTSNTTSSSTTTATHGFHHHHHHHQLSSSADARPYMMNGGNGMSPDSYHQQRSLFLHPSSTSMLSSSLSRLHSIPESSGQYYGYGSLTAAAAAAPSSTPTGGFADYYDDNDLNDAMLPSSLNELLTPTELQMRRAREQHHLHSPSMRSPLDWPSQQQQPTRLTNRSDYFTDEEPSAINIPGTSRHHHIRSNIGAGTGFFDETRSSSTNNNRLFDNDSFSPFMDDEGPFVMEDTGPMPPITTATTSNNSITARSSSSSSSQQQQPGDRRLTPFEFPSLISIPKSS